MRSTTPHFVVLAAPLLAVAWGAVTLEAQTSATTELPAARQITGPDVGPEPQLVAPKATPSVVNFPRVNGWPAVNPDGSGVRVYARGLRNPNGLAWEPERGGLWTVAIERDELGELVPDYLTSVREGAFYGWPYAYWGRNEDPRRTGEWPDIVATTIAPEFAVGAHTATLGFVFGDRLNFTGRYRRGAFIGQHGSWNRSWAIGSPSCRLPTAPPAGQWRSFSPASSPIPQLVRSGDVRLAWPSPRTGRCWWRTTQGIGSGGRRAR